MNAKHMSLVVQVAADLTVAMKEKKAQEVAALRLLKTSLDNAAIDARGKEDIFDDTAAIAAAQRHVKQLREAMIEYRSGGRDDLADAAAAELHIVERYLPQQLTEDAIRQVVEATRARTGATQMGPLMSAVMQELKGKADGSVVRSVVEEALQA